MKPYKILSLLLCLSLIVGLWLPVTKAVDEEGLDTSLTDNYTEDSVCTCQQETDHLEGCPLYIVPEKVAEEENCICEPQPSEGEAHAEGCPLYTVPDTVTEPSDETICNCGASAGEVHADGCPLKEEPADDFDAAAAKAILLECTSAEEVEVYLSTLTEDQLSAVVNLFTEAEIREFAEKLGINVEIEEITPPVNYTRVGPLMDAVQTAPQRRTVRSASRAVQEENGLILSKSAVFDAATGKITITMEAYTTGTVTSSAHSIPVDVVMVLDESGSMTDSMQSFQKVYQLDQSKTYYVKSGNGYIQVRWCTPWHEITHSNGWYSGVHFLVHWGSRYEPKTSENDNTSGHVQFYEDVGSNQTKRAALIQAATEFTNKVHQDATMNDVDHRISVIGFSNKGSSTIKIGLSNDIRDNVANVRAAIAGLNANGGTYIEGGMANAKNVFDNAAATSATERKRVVIVFTDGIPGSGQWTIDTINNSANPAIDTAKTLKSTYGATIYTIGMLTDANPELEISDADDNAARTNKFLHYISSNYPNAQSMSDGGAGGGNKGYYLSASDMASLNAIFTRISEEIATPAIQLDAQTQIRDIITPQFAVPSGTSEIHLYTDNYTGTGFANNRVNADRVTAQIANNQITVQGFNFNENFVSETAKPDGTYGKKLIIEFETQPKYGFLGGNNVPTNDETSGVYDKEGNSIEVFPVPTVNVPIPEVTVTAEDQNVYLLHAMTEEECRDGTTATCVDVNLLDQAYYTGENAWKAAFVDITSVVTKPDGPLTQDSTYTLAVTVAPKQHTTAGASGTPAAEQTGSKEANIKVFKPELTFRDSQVYYGADVPELGDSLTQTLWKHVNEEAVPQNMLGRAPDLTVTYTPEDDKISAGKINTKQDVGVDVSVKIGSTDITDQTTFLHTVCTGQSCTLPEGKEFLLHVNTCQLTITKTGGASGESYVFNVYKDRDKYSEVTIVGNTSQTLYELPVGNYTIEEDTGWSWRYTADNGSSAALTTQNPTGSITCTNTKSNFYWLNGFSTVVRNIFGTSSNAGTGSN